MHRWIAAAAASGMLLAGCGSDEDDAAKPAAEKAAPVAAKAAIYAPTSDVTGNGAIGKDVAAIRALLEPEGADAKPDFAAAAKIWSKGQNSTKSDGTKRTLAEWVDKQAAGTGVADALAGKGSAAGLSDGARVEMVDKGMTVSLRSHALEEFDGAKEKLAAGELDPEEGAIHNIDEVWAYYHAEGHGVGATAAKRSADFGLDEHALGNDVIAGITAAQAAVTAKDAAALDAAAEQTRGAMNKIFALAVKKYAVEGEAEGDDGAKARAEGLAFSWGLDGQLDAKDLRSVQAAFAAKAAPAGAAKAVAGTLDGAAAKLGFSGPLPAYPAS